MSDHIWQGWHFLRSDRRLGYGDGRLVVAGETLTIGGPPVLCQYGLHASRRAIDALKFAPGNIICRVHLSGEILEEHDKAVATERSTIWIADANDVLRQFARSCALSVAHLWNMPPIVRQYLETGDESIRAAAWDAARAGARAAAWDAAWDAARAAARAAAWDAARAAAWDAAWAAAWAAQNTELERLLLSLGEPV